MKNDLRGKAVLITGGTRGIGLATALAFGRHGARCTLTHKWGSVDEDEVRNAFEEASAPPPMILQADAASEEDTASIVAALRERHHAIEVFVSNVAFAQPVSGPVEYTRRALLSSIEYGAWPLVSYCQKIRTAFGSLPRYVVGVSSAGPDGYLPNYDLAACAKSTLETLGRYLAHHWHPDGVRVNILRAGMVRTQSLEAMLGARRIAELEASGSDIFCEAGEIAEAVLALCSGWMDGVSGQVITVDGGRAFASNGLFAQRNGR